MDFHQCQQVHFGWLRMSINILPKNSFEDYLGIPYKEHGRTKEEGFDCWGLMLELVKKIYGVVLPDPNYKITTFQDPNDIIMTYDISQWVIPIPITQISYGDLIALRIFTVSKIPCHIGMCIGNREIIHTMNHGVVIHKLNILKKYTVGIYRFNIHD